MVISDPTDTPTEIPTDTLTDISTDTPTDTLTDISLDTPTDTPTDTPPDVAPDSHWTVYGAYGHYCGTYDSFMRHETTEVEECRSLCLASLPCNVFAVGYDCVWYVVCEMTKEGENSKSGFTYEFRDKSGNKL